MIEIITEQVKMPSEITERRFQREPINAGKKWKVVDTHCQNAIVFHGGFETASIACHNLNKKFYRDEACERSLNNKNKITVYEKT